MSESFASETFERDKIWVVIPTLNELSTVGAVVRACLPFCAQVLVVDGGSTDGTIEAAQEAGARVDVVRQKGKGRALRYALRVVPVPITVFLDADGSHDASDIARLAAPVLAGEAAMIVACRWTGGSDELHGDMNKWLRRAGSRVLTSLVNLRWGTRLTDIQNGFRAVRTDIGREIGLHASDFTIEQEMIMKFLGGGFHVRNLPSHEYARQGGEAKLNLGRVWVRFGVSLLRHLLNMEGPRLRRASRRK